MWDHVITDSCFFASDCSRVGPGTWFWPIKETPPVAAGRHFSLMRKRPMRKKPCHEIPVACPTSCFGCWYMQTCFLDLWQLSCDQGAKGSRMKFTYWEERMEAWQLSGPWWLHWTANQSRAGYSIKLYSLLYKILEVFCQVGFPDGSVGKASACIAGDLGLIPGLGRSPGEGNGNPLQYSCLENSMDRGAL